MALVEADGVAEAAESLLQLLGEHQLVTQQRVGVGEARVHLDGAREELDGDVVLPLQTETVTGDTPGLRELKIQEKVIVYWFIHSFCKPFIGLLLDPLPPASSCPCPLGL